MQGGILMFKMFEFKSTRSLKKKIRPSFSNKEQASIKPVLA